MSMRGKVLAEISEDDLQELIDNHVRESQTLEYKRECYGRSDDQVREMLRDVSSIANAFGGDLLIGIDEDGDGTAINLLGIDKAEEEAHRLVSSCLSNIDERISGLATKTIPLRNGRDIIVVRVPRSPRLPHMITFKGLNQFWIRHDRQKSPMSTHEIRDACLKNEELMEKLTRFLDGRKTDTAAKIATQPFYVISSTPIVLNSDLIDIQDSALRKILKDPPNQRREGWNMIFENRPFPTLHGLRMDETYKTLDVLRNGHIELRVRLDDAFLATTQAFIPESGKLLKAYPLVEYPVSMFRVAQAIYSHVGLIEPLAVCLAILNSRSFALTRNPGQGDVLGNRYYGPNSYEEDTLEIEPLQVSSLDRPEVIAKQLLDRLWQAFGFDHAPLFDANGNLRLN